MNAREAAYLALLSSMREEKFISESLENWRREESPQQNDFNLAQEIAYGSCHMRLSLDFIAEQMSDKKKLSLKAKEKAILHTALYQKFFMDRIPLYAITNETIQIAKKYCHSSFVGFLNAVLRKIGETNPTLPQNLSIQFSYPEFFIKELQKDYSRETTIKILEVGNKPAPIMVRARNKKLPLEGLKIVTQDPWPVGILEDKTLFSFYTSSKDYYVQNATPAILIGTLCQKTKPPHTTLDLSAAPGGKTIAVHDFFPKAKLFANDISEFKVNLLRQNLKKYDIEATLSFSAGEIFYSDTKFDLIILDVPCSNTGVLNKRAEARWRLSAENLEKLEKIQLALIENAVSLLAPGGSIWYMTCSILKSENERLIEKACDKYSLNTTWMETILPNEQGWDGGFGCNLVLCNESFCTYF